MSKKKKQTTKTTKRPAQPGGSKPPAVRTSVKAGKPHLDRPGGGC